MYFDKEASNIEPGTFHSQSKKITCRTTGHVGCFHASKKKWLIFTLF